MPRIDPAAVPKSSGTRYPRPFDEPCRKRSWLRLGDAAGLTQFGVNLLRLPPGAWSSQRHWHSHEDEFVYVLRGEVVLVDDDGEVRLRPGDSAGFPAGDRNGHCLQNRSEEDAERHARRRVVTLCCSTSRTAPHGTANSSRKDRSSSSRRWPRAASAPTRCRPDFGGTRAVPRCRGHRAVPSSPQTARSMSSACRSRIRP